jgi:hypothetical protein
MQLKIVKILGFLKDFAICREADSDHAASRRGPHAASGIAVRVRSLHDMVDFARDTVRKFCRRAGLSNTACRNRSGFRLLMIDYRASSVSSKDVTT